MLCARHLSLSGSLNYPDSSVSPINDHSSAELKAAKNWIVEYLPDVIHSLVASHQNNPELTKSSLKPRWMSNEESWGCHSTFNRAAHANVDPASCSIALLVACSVIIHCGPNYAQVWVYPQFIINHCSIRHPVYKMSCLMWCTETFPDLSCRGCRRGELSPGCDYSSIPIKAEASLFPSSSL